MQILKLKITKLKKGVWGSVYNPVSPPAGWCRVLVGNGVHFEGLNWSAQGYTANKRTSRCAHYIWKIEAKKKIQPTNRKLTKARGPSSMLLLVQGFQLTWGGDHCTTPPVLCFCDGSKWANLPWIRDTGPLGSCSKNKKTLLPLPANLLGIFSIFYSVSQESSVTRYFSVCVYTKWLFELV